MLSEIVKCVMFAIANHQFCIYFQLLAFKIAEENSVELSQLSENNDIMFADMHMYACAHQFVCLLADFNSENTEV